MVRLFAHRGFATTKAQQNTIKSLKAAHQKNFFGIEFDIWFIDGNLLLKHDAPKKSELKNLPHFGEYLVFRNNFFYWLDFKNLDEKNAEIILKKVHQEIIKAGINLDQIYFAPFITDYKKAAKIFAKIRKIFGQKTQIVAVCEKLKNFADIKNLRDFLSKNNIQFLSIFHQLLDATFVKIFPEIEIFAWTVNDLSRLRELEKLSIKNIATDKITPKKFKPWNKSQII